MTDAAGARHGKGLAHAHHFLQDTRRRRKKGIKDVRAHVCVVNYLVVVVLDVHYEAASTATSAVLTSSALYKHDAHISDI